MKKIFATLIASCLLAASILTGCGNNASNDGNATGNNSKNEKVTIDIIQNKSEISTELEEAIKTYTSLNPNIKINLETVQGNDYNTSLKAKMLGGDPVEIFAASFNDMLNNYYNYLEDLSDQPWVEHISDSLVADCTLDDKIAGLPISIEGYGLVYNKEIFEAAGIDTTTLTSYNAIDAAFAQLQSKIDAGELAEKYPLLEAVSEYAAKESWIPGLHSVNLLFATQFKGPREVMEADSVSFSAVSDFEKTMQLLTKYTAAGKAGNLALLNAIDYSSQIGGGLGIERVAVVQQGNWIGPELKNISEELSAKMDMMPLPMPGLAEDSIYVGVPMYWCVNNTSGDAEKQAAKEFMNWLFQSEEGKSIVVNKFGYLPAFDNYDSYPVSDPLSQAVQRYVAQGKTIAWMINGFPSGYEPQAAADIQAYLGGDIDFAECVKKLGDDFTALK